MSMPARWKVVLVLIATFAADALTGGLSTGRVIKDAVRRVEQPPQPSALTMSTGALSRKHYPHLKRRIELPIFALKLLVVRYIMPGDERG
jgi:hypothetical protein